MTEEERALRAGKTVLFTLPEFPNEQASMTFVEWGRGMTEEELLEIEAYITGAECTVGEVDDALRKLVDEVRRMRACGQRLRSLVTKWEDLSLPYEGPTGAERDEAVSILGEMLADPVLPPP